MGGKSTPEYQKEYRAKKNEEIKKQRAAYRKTPEYKAWLDATREYRTAYGSKRQKERKESSVEEWLKHLLKSCKSRKRKKENKPIQCTLTLEVLLDQFNKQNGLCGICQLPLEWKQESLMSISIDRIDNNLDYTPENIHLVAKWLNIGRGTSSLQDIREIVNRLRQTHSDKIEKP